MVRINISVPDYIQDDVRRFGVPVSQVCQEALAREAAQRSAHAGSLYRYRLVDGDWRLVPGPSSGSLGATSTGLDTGRG